MMNLRQQVSYGSDHSTDEPIVSVLMPCFNVAQTVDEAISSILDQTLRALEVVAVDDGSTDLTGKRLEAWAQRDARVRVLSLPHGGIIAALNAGLAACRASLIARMDADDRAHPERLAKQVVILDRRPDVALVSCLVKGFPPGEIREGFRLYIEWLNSLVDHESINKEIFVESPFVHPSVVIRKEWLERLGGYQEYGWPEDYDLWLRMYLEDGVFAKVPEVLLYWREHPTRLTRTDARYSVENFLRAKAHYICQGPLKDRDAVLIWGAGRMGRRLSKHLLRGGSPIVAFIDIDPKKIGRTRKGRPILSPEALPEWWLRYKRPAVLAAVGSRGARELIRKQMNGMGFSEGVDWWAVA